MITQFTFLGLMLCHRIGLITLIKLQTHVQTTRQGNLEILLKVCVEAKSEFCHISISPFCFFQILVFISLIYHILSTILFLQTGIIKSRIQTGAKKREKMREIRFEDMYRMFKSSVHQVHLKGPELHVVILHVWKTRPHSYSLMQKKSVEGHCPPITVLGTENLVL